MEGYKKQMDDWMDRKKQMDSWMDIKIDWWLDGQETKQKDGWIDINMDDLMEKKYMDG